MVDYNETRKRLDSVLSDTKQGDTHHEKSTSRRIQCLHARDSHGQHLGSVWLGWGVKVTATPRILSCCALPPVCFCSPSFCSAPLNSLSPSVLFSVPQCLVLSSLRQSHQVSWLFVAVLTGSPSYCSKLVYTQQNLSGILGGFVLRTLLRTKPGFNWGVFKQTGLGTQGPIPVGKLSCE